MKIFFFAFGRALGAASLVSLSYLGFGLLTNTSVLSTISQADLINAAEEIIVYIDYRPQEKFTECTNLEKSEWGLLVNNTKISVAQPQKSGGYIFKTKSCLFNDGDVPNIFK